MPLFFITGVSASGKSSLTHELRSKGYKAYDTDDDALARWQNNETSYIHPKSSVKAEDRTEDFLKAHSWNVPREFIEDIHNENQDNTAFVCGVANNVAQLSDLFTSIFALTIDEETLRDRLASRTNNDWGKQPHELQQTLDSQQGAVERYKGLGYILIDASQPLSKVADDILTQIDP